MITASDRHALLVADRTRDADVIRRIVDFVLSENPRLTLLDVETAFRDAAAHSYIIAGNPFEIVIGFPAWLAVLDEMGIEPQDNRATLESIARK